ncbi:MAG: HesA/MoeB/ThiF family protein [Polyangiaceae bacterium]|nr:HesA/MoeB/ThiF family protein [Polyangiaceae bacterium]
MSSLSNQTALIVGVGGLGCPAALALARAGIGRLILADNDTVAESNLPRQVLFDEADIGRDKLDAAKEALAQESSSRVELFRGRLRPENARELIAEADIVIEGADNFPTKFLAADAAHLEKTPIVHGAAIQWRGTAWLVEAQGQPCYRCVFEDILPADQSPNCNEAGVIGPLTGIVGAFMADLALDALQGDLQRSGTIFSIDAQKMSVRPQQMSPRLDCTLCGSTPQIHTVDYDRYVGPLCSTAS